MYPASNRLRKSKEITKLFTRGKSFSTPIAIFRYSPNKLNVTRLAVVVGTKVHKRAAARNLIKRRVREVLRTKLPEMKKGFDIAVVARPAAFGRTFDDIQSTVSWALQKINMLKR